MSDLKDKEINVEATLPLEALAQMLGQRIDCGTLVEFVKRLDAYAEDLDVTKLLRDYFVAEVDREESVEGADFDGDWENV